MNDLANELLAFYQKELMSGESADAQTCCEKLGVTDAGVFERYGIGYCSGQAIEAMSQQQQRQGIDEGLIHQHPLGERFRGSLVIPVYGFDEHGEEVLVDLHGVRAWDSGVRYVPWHPRKEGLIGLQGLRVLASSEQDQVILCDNAFHFLHAAQHGYTNVLAVREGAEVEQHLDLLEQSGIKRVCLASRQQRKIITPLLESRGIKVKFVKTPSGALVIPKVSYEEALIADEERPKFKPSAAKPQAAMPKAEIQPAVETTLKLISQTECRLTFTAETKDTPRASGGHAIAGAGVRYVIDSTAITGLAMKVQLRAQLEDDPKASFLDKVDLGAAASRQKTAKQCAGRLGIPAGTVEDHLSLIAEKVDSLMLEASSSVTHQPAPRQLSNKERDEALRVLENQDVLSYLANALDRVFGCVGEGKAKRVALLVATSRLLDAPTGCLMTGPPGVGKSALMRNVAATLPPNQVLYFSRISAQALYFLSQDQLNHKLFVCDEYEGGLAGSEYALRTLMSSQTLSVAITSRDGGGLPVTRTKQLPARLAVMMSSTGTIDEETRSRFIEIGLTPSPEQTRRVMRSMAEHCGQISEAEARRVQNVQMLLRPCVVRIPFADKLAYDSPNVFARRQFARVIAMIASHACLHQLQRPTQKTLGGDESGPLNIEATRADYEAVYPLLDLVVDHHEEDITANAMSLLRAIADTDTKYITREQTMELMSWSYSKTFRVLQELKGLDLLVPDHHTNGRLKTYEVTASHFATDSKVSQLPPPEVVFSASPQTQEAATPYIDVPLELADASLPDEVLALTTL